MLGLFAFTVMMPLYARAETIAGCEADTILTLSQQQAKTPIETRLSESLTLGFRQQFADVVSQAKQDLRRKAFWRWNRKMAVVLDLDETLMDNRAYFARHKVYEPDRWHQWVLKAEASAIPETLDFVKWLDRKDFKIYFISGRKEKERAATLANLKAMGVSEVDGVYLKPDDYDKASAANFKVAARKEIEAKGYDITVVMGDQCSDLRGGYGSGDELYKLPNAIYTIP